MIRHPPRPLLYELVGLGMAGYARMVHRAVLLGGERLRLEPGVVLVCTHLSDADVPVLAGALYRGAHMWRDPTVIRPSFAVASDLLIRGYLAGYPRGLPLIVRRGLWPVGIGPVMSRWVRCLPIRFADRMRLVEALRELPDLELAEALAPARVAALRRRAEELGRPAPRLARDVLAGAYADLIWQDVYRAELNGAVAERLWEERLVASTVDLRRLVRYVRGGGALILFPHGQVSSGGGIDRLDPRPARLLHIARATVQPVAVGHDPLTRGRPRAFVGIGEATEAPPRRGGERELLSALRRTLPLTCGLVVARALAFERVPARTAEMADAVDRAVERARRDGRPIEPALEDPESRRSRVAEATGAARRMGAQHAALRRAARTYATALEPVP
jgi:hypothetical protein